MGTPRDTLAGLRILVVEDEMLIAMLLMQMLQELQCEVIGPVSSVKDAIAAVRAHPLDGALLDMNLRGESSSPAAHECIDRAVPFLLVTGYDANNSEPPRSRRRRGSKSHSTSKTWQTACWRSSSIERKPTEVIFPNREISASLAGSGAVQGLVPYRRSSYVRGTLPSKEVLFTGHR
jgi:CheY-like chemotaxis protein